jgi:hypothetical protein
MLKTYTCLFILFNLFSTHLSAQFARQGKDYAVFFVASKFDHGWNTLDEDLCTSQKGSIVDKGCPEKSPIKEPDNMVLIPGGTFQMGSSENDREKPVHSVTVSSFYMGKFEVTVAEFRAFIKDKNYQTDAEREGCSYGYEGTTWKSIKGRNWRHDPEGNPAPDDHPVINVSWNDATEYCKWMA